MTWEMLSGTPELFVGRRLEIHKEFLDGPPKIIRGCIEKIEWTAVGPDTLPRFFLKGPLLRFTGEWKWEEVAGHSQIQPEGLADNISREGLVEAMGGIWTFFSLVPLETFFIIDDGQEHAFPIGSLGDTEKPKKA